MDNPHLAKRFLRMSGGCEYESRDRARISMCVGLPPRFERPIRGFFVEGRAMLISGRCHCGNISFALDWRPEPSEIPARACTCSFCVKHGGVWTSCPSGSLTVNVKDRARLSKYAFGTKTAEFHLCTACGVVPVVTSQIDGRLYAVVSVNAFENIEPALLRRSPSTFEGENEQARLSRRKRNWIADVQFEATS
jgi:hypothetical protein